MTSLIYLFAFALLGQSRGDVVELNCSDNATCIDHMAKEFARSLRQQKTIKLFDLFTIEPLGNRQARSSQDPLTRLITTHAISFDWNDFTFRFSNPEDRSDALDLEVFESRSVKDVSDDALKKSKDKEGEDAIENKKGALIRPIKRRRHRRKVMQAVVPLLFGMKSAGVAIFALFMVSVITIKAFLASKMALMVTVGMAMKKLYESYGGGVPATSFVLWNLARYFRILFGLPEPQLSASMNMPMYTLPQMQNAMQNAMQNQMFNPTMPAMPTN